MTDREQLRRIRTRLDAIAPGVWLRAADGEGEFVEAHGEMQGERVMLCRFHGLASEDERAFVVEAPSIVRFLLRLLDRAIEAARAHGRTAPAALASAGAGETSPGPPSRARPGADAPSAGAAGGEASGAPREAKNYAAEAAMKCAEPGFKKFLEETHGLERPLTDERAAQKVRSLCGVTSRRELNDDAKSAEAWRDLVRQFDAWRRRG